jgi:hypothetical protein
VMMRMKRKRKIMILTSKSLDALDLRNDLLMALAKAVEIPHHQIHQMLQAYHPHSPKDSQTARNQPRPINQESIPPTDLSPTVNPLRPSRNAI